MTTKARLAAAITIVAASLAALPLAARGTVINDGFNITFTNTAPITVTTQQTVSGGTTVLFFPGAALIPSADISGQGALRLLTSPNGASPYVVTMHAGSLILNAASEINPIGLESQNDMTVFLHGATISAVDNDTNTTGIGLSTTGSLLTITLDSGSGISGGAIGLNFNHPGGNFLGSIDSGASITGATGISLTGNSLGALGEDERYTPGLVNGGHITGTTGPGLDLTGRAIIHNVGAAASISSITDAAIYVQSGGILDLTNQQATILSPDSAIDSGSAGIIMGITNLSGGLIQSTASGAAIHVDGNLTLVQDGVLGVSRDNQGLTNDATIHGFQQGVYVNGSAVITNQSNGLITADHGAGIHIDNGTLTLSNRGNITAPSGIGVNFQSSTSLSIVNLSGGTISGTYDGVRTASGSFGQTITNLGDITSSSRSGVHLTGDGFLTINNGHNPADDTFNPGATISGSSSGTNAGILLDNDGFLTLDNWGPISGRYGISLSNGSGANITNHGSGGGIITGAGDAIRVRDGSLTLTNFNFITGTNGDGVDFKGGGTVTINNLNDNQQDEGPFNVVVFNGVGGGGSITGQWQGIDVEGTLNLTNASGAQIIGQNSDGVRIEGSAPPVGPGAVGANNAISPSTIVNHGLISGDTNAIRFSGFLHLENDGFLDGSILGSGGPAPTFVAPAIPAGSVLELGTNDIFENFYDGTISGVSQLSKVGSGIWRLGGTTTATNVFVDGGTLIVNGDLNYSDVHVFDGATLGGEGRLFGAVGTVTIHDGGTLAPGDFGIGSLTINDNLVFESGATAAFELRQTSEGHTNDFVQINGNATINEGATLHVSDESISPIPDGEVFRIANYTGTGTLDGAANIVDDSVVLSYTADTGVVADDGGSTDVFLIAHRAGYKDFGSTGNNAAVGQGLDGALASQLDGGDDALNDLFLTLDHLDDPAAIDAILHDLSPEQLGAPVDVSVKVAQQYNRAISEYLAGAQGELPGLALLNASGHGAALASVAADPALVSFALAVADTQPTTAPSTMKPAPTVPELGLNVFIKPFGLFGSRDQEIDRVGYDFHAVGFMAGVDKRISRSTVVGLMIAYDNDRITYDRAKGLADSDNVRGGPYVSYVNGKWIFNGSATFGGHWTNNTRNVTMPVAGTSRSSYDAWDVALYGDAGYRIDLGHHTTLTPMLSVNYDHYNYDGYTETGGPANLSVLSNSVDYLRGTVGVNLSRTYKTADCTLVPEISIAYVRDFLNDNDVTSRFAVAPGSSPFTVKSGVGQDNGVAFGLGLTALVRSNVSLYVRYDGEVTESTDQHFVSVGLTLKW